MRNSYLLFFYFASLNAIFSQQQPLLEVKADEYEICITNVAPYSLKVHWVDMKGKAVESELLQPFQKWECDHNFPKGRLQNTYLICEYDNYTFDLDKKWAIAFMEVLQAGGKPSLDPVLDNFLENIRDTSGLALLNLLEHWFGTLGNTASLKELIEKEQYEAVYLNRVALAPQVDTSSGNEALLLKASIRPSFSRALAREGATFLQTIADSTEYKAIKQYMLGALLLLTDRQLEQRNVQKSGELATVNYRSKSPSFVVSIEPFNHGNSLNGYWKTPKDRLLEDIDDDGELDWSGDIFDRNFGASIHVGIGPEIYIAQGLPSRFYAGISYHKTAFYLDSLSFYTFSDNFFSTAPPQNDNFVVNEKVTFDQERFALNVLWRFLIGNIAFVELNGGIAQLSGKVNLKNAYLDAGNQWVRKRVKMTDNTLTPIYGFKVGVGNNAHHSGFHISAGLQLFRARQRNNSDYYILDISDYSSVPFDGKGKTMHRVNLGISFGF